MRGVSFYPVLLARIGRLRHEPGRARVFALHRYPLGITCLRVLKCDNPRCSVESGQEGHRSRRLLPCLEGSPVLLLQGSQRKKRILTPGPKENLARQPRVLECVPLFPNCKLRFPSLPVLRQENCLRDVGRHITVHWVNALTGIHITKEPDIDPL